MLFEMVLGVVCGIAPAIGLHAQDVVRSTGAQASHMRDTAGDIGTKTKVPTSDAKLSTTATEAQYRIGPEDMLLINVFKEADFSSSVLVRTDGKISLPLLNDVQAVGLTPSELSATLQEQLAHFLKDPKVTVVVTQMNSRRAYVMGMVNRQGMVRLLANSTVLQALSAAGGLAPFARSKQIYILRGDGQAQRKIPFNYDAVIKGKHPEQNILLEPGDTVVVP